MRTGITFLVALALTGAWLLPGALPETPVASRVDAPAEGAAPAEPPRLRGPRRTAERHEAVAEPEDLVTFRGHVVDERGRPVSGAAVFWSRCRGALHRADVTGADGGFGLSVPTEHVDVEIRHPNGRRVRAGLFDKDPRDVRLRLKPAAPLGGVVRIEADGTPVEGARVEAWHWRFGRVEARTGADGRFRLVGVPKGIPFDVQVEAGPQGRTAREDLVWAEGATLELLLPEVRTLRGRVVRETPTGLAGVAGVPVSLCYRTGGSSYSGVTWSGVSTEGDARTDANGRFVLEGMTRGGEISIQSDVWRTVPDDPLWRWSHGRELLIRVEAKPPEVAEAPRAKHSAWIAGRIVDDEDAPVASCAVGASQGGPTRYVRTDRTGAFRIAALRPGTYELILDALDHDWRKVRDVEVGESGLEVGTLSIDRLVPRTLRVVDEGGEAIPYADVRWWPNPPGSWVPVRTNGSWTIGLPKAREFHVDVRARGFVPRRLRREHLPEDPSSTWQIVLARAFAIQGRVVGDRGAPVASARVRCSGERYRSPLEGVLTDLLGGFRIEVPVEGTYELRVVDTSLVFAPVAGVRTGELDFVIQPATPVFLAGRLLAPDGSPLPCVHVAAEPIGNGVGGSTTTDRDGRFRLERLVGRVFRIETNNHDDDLERLGLAVRVLSHVMARTDGLELRAERTMAIAGDVVHPDGSPAVGFDVLARRDGTQCWQGENATDARGRFEITGLLPGTYELHAWAWIPREGATEDDEEGEDYFDGWLQGVEAGAQGARVVVRWDATEG